MANSLSPVENRCYKACLVCLIVFIAIGFSADRASAACGDYVLVNGRLAHAEASQQKQGSHGSLPIQIPCEGPGCRQIPGSLPLERAVEQHRTVVIEMVCDGTIDVNEMHNELQPLRFSVLPQKLLTSHVWRPPE